MPVIEECTVEELSSPLGMDATETADGITLVDIGKDIGILPMIEALDGGCEIPVIHTWIGIRQSEEKLPSCQAKKDYTE